MKALKPSHRDKRRYLLILGKDADKQNIEKCILEYIGILGFAEASPHFIKINKERVILSINRNSLDKVRASFVASDREIRVERVSGAVGKLK
jgi:RNase P/RNase MRP subunit POP5